jgi:hypothetical protein
LTLSQQTEQSAAPHTTHMWASRAGIRRPRRAFEISWKDVEVFGPRYALNQKAERKAGLLAPGTSLRVRLSGDQQETSRSS